MTSMTAPRLAEPLATDRRSWWQRILHRRAAGRNRSRIPRSTVALLAVSIALPLALFGLAAARNWRDVQRGAENHVERTTRLLHEHALKIFETQQLMIDQVNERLRTLDWSNPGDVASLHGLLDHLRNLLPQVVDIVVTDAGGHVRASSFAPAPGENVDVSDRDYFKVLRVAPQSLPYISRATIGRRSGLRVFNMAARVQNASGQFDGVISIALDQAYFDDFYRDIEQNYRQIVVLAREDGNVLASEPAMADHALPPEALQGLQTTGHGHRALVHPSMIDGKMRIFGYEKVGAFPVVIGFGISRKSAFAPWWRDMRAYGLVAALSSLALLGVSGFAIRRIRLEGAATVSWRRSAALLEKEIVERTRVEDQLRQAQKMEAVGQLTGGIAHDFNNLLTVVIGNLDLLSRRMPEADGRLKALVQNAIEGANRAASLTSRLLSFSRQQALDPKPLDVNALIDGMSNLLGRTLGEAVSIELALDAHLGSTLVDPNQLENAILNLCVNAVDAMPNGGRLTIETKNVVLDEAFCARNEDLAAGRYVAISVADTGSGMSPEVIARAFEPFFTTKPVGKGTGLGLSQLYGFARQSGGIAEIASHVGDGTTVRIFLPQLMADLPKREFEASTPATRPVEADTRGTTVLVVEDDDLVRGFSSGALREAGYVVVEAATGLSGLQAVQDHPDIALLFTDIVLKGPMNGRELAEKVAVLRPDLPVLFTTGYTKDAAVNEGGPEMIRKPFTTAALTARIASLLAQAELHPVHDAVA